MAETDNIHDDIREMRTLLIESIGANKTTQAKFDTLLERELPALWGAAKGAQATANQAKAIAAKANARITKQNTYAAGWAAGATAVVITVKGYLTAKFGLHF